MELIKHVDFVSSCFISKVFLFQVLSSRFLVLVSLR